MRIRLALALAFLGLPAAVSAQPVFDAASSGNATATTTLSFSHTLGGGSNRALYCVATSGGNSVNVNTGTYDGDAGVELVENAGTPTFVQMAIYRWKESSGLATGTATVTFTFASATNVHGACMSFSNVDQTTPDDGVTTQNVNNSGDFTKTVTSASGDLAIDFNVGQGNCSSATPGAGQTERVDHNFASESNLIVASTEPGAASVVMDWTPSPAVCAHRGAGINLNVSGAAAAPTPTLTLRGVG